MSQAQDSLSDGAFDQLKADVDFLGRALGTVLRELSGKRLFDLVEEMRGLTKRLRAEPEDDQARRALQRLVVSLSLDEAEGLVRAFTVYFQLINVAEEIHRVRVNRLREGQATKEAPRGETVAAAIKALKDEGWSYGAARRFVEELDIGLTLTAHPTEVKRYTVRLKLERVASAMRRRGEQALAPQERARLEAAIHAEIATLWQTRELVSEKPSVLDEVKSALYYFRRSLLATLPRLMLDLERAFADYYHQKPTRALSPVLTFRSWIGGDRDGNPFVTPEVTAEAYGLQAALALDAYLGDVDGLVQRLSQWEGRVSLSPAFRDALARLEAESGPPPRFLGEPYRRKLFFMHRALLAEKASEPSRYRGGASAYGADLSLLEETLQGGQGQRVAEVFVRPVRYRAALFGFHLAALDLREHSQKHQEAVADLLRYAGLTDDYAALDEAARIALLAGELSSPRPLAPPGAPLGEETRRALAFLEVFRDTQERLGTAATGSYVVSMTEGVSDVLEVLVLAKQAGVSEIDATPLFETVTDLENAPGVMRELFSLPSYLAHVRRRGVQEVMIGYSDSNKDAGFLAANWALYLAQARIAAVCKEAGVPLRLFHGRGTSIGRGGGPAGRAILAQPPGSLGGRMRLTEQGEAMSERYADPDLAHRHLEQVVHAFILSSARDARGDAPELPSRYREAMEAASAASRALYRELLEDPGFLDFYGQVTPIEEISRLNIGSRPARRGGEPSLSSLRAIPWVFSWTQCRANLPGWYGLGSGLAALEQPLLAEMYREWPFFKAVVDFAQMSLAKADMGIFAAYTALVEDQALRERFWQRVAAEHARSVEAVTAATGKGLLADSTLARGIDLRNPYVDPISYLQVELLGRLRALPEESAEREALEYAVLVSLTGVSAGMRNTG